MIWSNIMQILKSNSKARFEIYYYANFKHHWIWENMSLHRKRHLRISKHDCKTFQNITFPWRIHKAARIKEVFFENATYDAHKDDAVHLGMHNIAIVFISNKRIEKCVSFRTFNGIWVSCIIIWALICSDIKTIIGT